MNIKKLFFTLIISVFCSVVSVTPGEAHGHGGFGWHGGGGWHEHRHWGLGLGLGLAVPFFAEPYVYHRPYYRDDVALANNYIARGRQKIRQGHWYIDHGSPIRGDALIQEGQDLIDRGNAILGRY